MFLARDDTCCETRSFRKALKFINRWDDLNPIIICQKAFKYEKHALLFRNRVYPINLGIFITIYANNNKKMSPVFFEPSVKRHTCVAFEIFEIKVCQCR